MTTEKSLLELMQELTTLMRDPDIRWEIKNIFAKSESRDGKVHMSHQNDRELDEDTLANEELRVESHNTSLDLHVIGSDEDQLGEKNITTVLSPNKDSTYEGLEAKGFTEVFSSSVVWDEYAEEEQVEGNTDGALESAMTIAKVIMLAMIPTCLYHLLLKVW